MQPTAFAFGGMPVGQCSACGLEPPARVDHTCTPNAVAEVVGEPLKAATAPALPQPLRLSLGTEAGASAGGGGAAKENCPEVRCAAMSMASGGPFSATAACGKVSGGSYTTAGGEVGLSPQAASSWPLVFSGARPASGAATKPPSTSPSANGVDAQGTSAARRATTSARKASSLISMFTRKAEISDSMLARCLWSSRSCTCSSWRRSMWKAVPEGPAASTGLPAAAGSKPVDLDLIAWFSLRAGGWTRQLAGAPGGASVSQPEGRAAAVDAELPCSPPPFLAWLSRAGGWTRQLAGAPGGASASPPEGRATALDAELPCSPPLFLASHRDEEALRFFAKGKV